MAWSIVYGPQPANPVNASIAPAAGALSLAGSTPQQHAGIAPLVGAILAAGAQPTVAISGGPPPGTNYLGVNSLDGFVYFSNDQPALNLLKQSGGNSFFCPWITNNSDGAFDTGEEAYLAAVLDENEYPTTLTVPGIPGGQQFNNVFVYMNKNLIAATPVPGAPASGYGLFPSYYETIVYTLLFEGQCVISLPSATNISSSTPGITIDGTTITSVNPWGTLNTVTFEIGANAIQLGLYDTGDGAGSNYFSAAAIVDSNYLAEYQAGQILHPLYALAMTNNGIGKGWSCIRTMGGQATIPQDINLNFSGTLAKGAISASLSYAGSTQGPQANNAWPLPSGTYSVVFGSGDVRPVAFTYNEPGCSWSGGLSAAVPQGNPGAQACACPYTWATRATPSCMTWATQSRGGVPYEAIFAICNELGTDAWCCVPAVANTADSTYAGNLAALAKDGTGAQLSDWNVSSFSGLTGVLFIELGDEISWSAGSSASGAAFLAMLAASSNIYAANASWGSGGQYFYAVAEQYGICCAGIAEAAAVVFGTGSSRVQVGMMTQFSVGSGVGFLLNMMNTPHWTSAAWTHGITHWGFAPYGGPAGGGAGSGTYTPDNWTTILNCDDPVTELFSLAYGDVGSVSGEGYPAVPGGWCGGTLNGLSWTSVQSMLAAVVGQPWAGLPVRCYESGFNAACGPLAQSTAPSAAAPVLTAMLRDARMGLVYNDPENALSENPGYWQAMQELGVAFACQFNFCTSVPYAADPNSLTSGWGVIEAITQTTEPLSAAPPRYAGCMDWINQDAA